MYLKVLNWEQYEIVFLKLLANQKSLAGKDGPLMSVSGHKWHLNSLLSSNLMDLHFYI